MNKLFLKVFLVVLIAPLVFAFGVFYLNNFEKALEESALDTLELHAKMITSFLSEEVLQKTLFEENLAEKERRVKDGFISKTSLFSPLGEYIEKKDKIQNEFFELSKKRSQKIIESLSPFQQVRIRLFDHNGLLRADTHEKHSSFESGVQYDKMGQVLTQGHKIRLRDKVKKELQVLMPVKKDGKIAGVLVVQSSDKGIEKKMQEIRQILLSLFILTLLLGILLSFYLTRTIVKPLNRLAEGALRTTQHYAAIPDLSLRGDDIGRLSKALIKMTKDLQTRLEAIESFAGDVAHELKNPLASLMNAVSVFPAIKAEEKKAELYHLIEETVLRMDRLITDISNYSRLDAELEREQWNKFSPFKMLTKMYGKNALNFEQKVQISFSKQAQKSLVAGEENRLAQVFSNLVLNAVSFSPKNGKILITGKQQENELIITVEDEGVGLPKGQEERIFSRFYSYRPSTQNGLNKHSGIGLSICQKIINAMGGEIGASCSQTLKGACFTIRLPLEREA